MATIVNMHQAKASLSRLVESALSGEEIIIARNGEPLVRLMPVQKKREQRPKDKVEAGTDFEFAGEEITGFEVPLATDIEKP